MHSHGIVHRDLKPGNVFRDEGLVKLGDYGLSKFISCSRRSGQTESVGTVHYMAPEIANGRYGKEIDIYALGIILYEMLTGRVPFEGESVGEVLMKHLTAEPDVSLLAEPLRGVVARRWPKIRPCDSHRSKNWWRRSRRLRPRRPAGAAGYHDAAAGVGAWSASAVRTAAGRRRGAGLAIRPRAAVHARSTTGRTATCRRRSKCCWWCWGSWPARPGSS